MLANDGRVVWIEDMVSVVREGDRPPVMRGVMTDVSGRKLTEVAMIAIARHAIDVDYKTLPALSMIGTGAIIIALAIGYYYFKRADLLKSATTNKMPAR